MDLRELTPDQQAGLAQLAVDAKLADASAYALLVLAEHGDKGYARIAAVKASLRAVKLADPKNAALAAQVDALPEPTAEAAIKEK